MLFRYNCANALDCLRRVFANNFASVYDLCRSLSPLIIYIITFLYFTLLHLISSLALKNIERARQPVDGTASSSNSSSKPVFYTIYQCCDYKLPLPKHDVRQSDQILTQ